jgi:small-conductance mechanosensitive channel
MNWAGLLITLRVFAVLLSLGAASLLPAKAIAQNSLDGNAFGLAAANWNRTLNAVEHYIESGQYSPEQTSDFRDKVLKIRESALDVSQRGAEALKGLEPRLEALGPKPEEGEPPESEEIADERKRLNEQISLHRARQSLADVTLARVDTLQLRLTAVDRERFVQKVFKEYPLPFDAEVLSEGFGQIFAAARAVLETGPTWWGALPENRKNLQTVLTFIGVLFLTILIAWAVRRVLLTRFGVRPEIEDPSYTRRLLAAVAEGVSRGIVPAAILGVIYFRAVSSDALITGPFAEVVANLCKVLIAYLLGVQIPRAALSPDNPNWRLTRLTAASSAALVRQIRVLAAVFATSDFCIGAAFAVSPDLVTPAVVSVFNVLVAVPLGLLILFFLRPSRWQFEEPEPEENVEADTDAKATPVAVGRNGFWNGLRIALVFLTVVAILAPFAGYGGLSNYLIGNLLSTGFLVGVMYILRGLLRELIGLFLGSHLIRETVGWDYGLRSKIKISLRILLDILLLPGLAAAVLPAWGLPFETLWLWVSVVFQGFEVGGVRLSPADILLGILAFFIILAVVRAFRGALSTRVLSQTRIDPGLQHSISKGIGYVGFVAAAAIAVLVMGVDLSGIAIVAGALSVGIGFGLQNVVNNFVSGLILLIERPIKVGDWVVVGTTEGMVKQINVRSTEIETFRRASVIIPNADLISNSVTNWTHKDRYGRIDLPIGVAYGTDTRKVEEVLLEVARKHERVLSFPAPFVVFQNFGNSSLDFELRAYTGDVLWQVLIASDMRHEIDKRFKEEGIEIPFPQRVVHMAPQAPKIEETSDAKHSGLPQGGQDLPEED